MRFTIFQDSRVGKRKSNQDRMAYSYSRDALLLVVAWPSCARWRVRTPFLTASCSTAAPPARQ